MDSVLIVIVDLQHFKLFEVEQDPLNRKSLEIIKSSKNLDFYLKADEKYSDRKGNFTSAQSSGSNENQNLKLEEERRRIQEIANKISDLLSRYNHKSWYFAAPEAINNQIVELLDEKNIKNMAINLKLNLANTPNNQILEHFSKK
ncbi:MAG: host attachment protein [Sulfurimonas sp.]|uniref:host attachment protein n=1 Tax=Sulfurimonas sp. TaxID=2022749 RepID=UPI0025E671FF|nr:host attachment protein [Sulfurimonas sp.]MCK9455137.1 host attachment protein [Sulfurimonas sp.]